MPTRLGRAQIINRKNAGLGRVLGLLDTTGTPASGDSIKYHAGTGLWNTTQ